jgi:Cep192 domain 4/Abnormal spindle-like microcephaly-assoc'd, ASPM-SPD-2-Hydin
VTDYIFEMKFREPDRSGRVGKRVPTRQKGEPAALKRTFVLATLTLSILVVLAAPAATAQVAATGPEKKIAAKTAGQSVNLPPRVVEAERFLAQRGWTPASRVAVMRSRAGLNSLGLASARMSAAAAGTASAATATWQPLGPTAVQTPAFGLVTGRVAALALDPSDLTGNHLYLGTTGGGVWVAQNAGTSNPSSVVFTPLTDTLGVLDGVTDASISIGALTVQPGGTGVILAGTGDPNDVLDSYYGAGILRSTDGGNTWSLISRTSDVEQGLGAQDFRFLGEGFAGFAWKTTNPQLVVAAVSQAYEGVLVNAERPGNSYEGLYYSSDGGATWHLSTISDGNGNYVQGPLAAFASPDGNAATSVVWNPVRQLFMAAVRFHGYYQSADGVTWTRMTVQPGSGLTTLLCPTDPGSTGSIACPIFRGTLAVNPSTGDTFAWTVDMNNQDQGLWQDQCGISGGICSNQGVTFSKQWNTSALQTNTPEGSVTIADGSYTLALAALPAGPGAGQDTLLLAGADDLWKCNLATGCVWRNTTNSTTCKSAQVGEFQHALAWDTANPLEIFVGNDSGLWRSTDAIGEGGQTCAASDSQHFQNLNGNLGSLTEVVSLSGVPSTPYTMMAGLGVNGTAGVKSSTAAVDWPQILGGYGGPVAIDPQDSNNWYVNNQAGVSIYRCAQSADCSAADFGASPVVIDADVGGDGLTMSTPAPFLLDPVDPSQLLVGTCRVWRGPADGSGWSGSNAISPILDGGSTSGACKGDALIRSMAAMELPGGGERVYLGMYGSANGGANLPGHVLSATVNPVSSSSPVWQDLTLSPVANDSNSLNKFGMDISSIFIDPHDSTGNTAYVTVEGAENSFEEIQVVYRTTDGGAHWTDLTANLPETPASSVVVDPQDANTVYIATDEGVYFTTQVASCAVAQSNCWSVYGTGLPAAPVVALSASPAGASSPVLVAATYGRGIWETPLWTAGTSLTSASVSPAALTFAGQAFGTTSSALVVTLQNTGSVALAVTAISMNGNFNETDNCVNASIAAGASCSVQVKFTPSAAGSQTGEMIISANVFGGQLTVDMTGTGLAAGAVSLTPASLDFGQVAVGATSVPLDVQAENASGTAVPISGISVTPPFAIASNSCGSISLAANTSCQVQVEFAPTQAGAATGTLTFTDGAGTQSVALAGSGAAAATDSLSTTTLSFSATVIGELSATQTITLTNSGDLTLTSIAIAASGPFQASSNCGTQLTGHAACTISVTFAPTQMGSQSGALTISDVLRPQIVSLAGTGVTAPVLGVSPAGLSFAGQQAGVASAPQTLTVSNSGGAPMANVGFQITGPAAASYSLGATTCGAALNNGSSCTVQIILIPASTGAIAATLTVSSSTLGVTPVSVSLNGMGQVMTGVGPTPAQLTFPTVGVGQSSVAQPVTITNGSSYAIGPLALAVNAPFVLAQNSCTGSLAAGANCTAAVIFQPTASGTATGALTVTSPSLAVPANVALSGMGFDFTTAISGSSSVTVAAGQTADFTVTIDPVNGAQGTFTYTCGTLPANALCLFNPTTTAVSSGATGTLTLEISTGKAGLARIESPGGLGMLPLTCGVVLLPLALVRRRKALLLMVLLAVMAGAMSSCTSSGGGTGGGTSSSGGSSATPPGTYTIPVTVASTGVTHAVTVTLTVD